MDADGQEWEGWNWRTEGDLMMNGAFFVPSGDGVNPQYSLASSMEPKPAAFIDQLTLYAGILLPNRYFSNSPFSLVRLIAFTTCIIMFRVFMYLYIVYLKNVHPVTRTFFFFFER